MGQNFQKTKMNTKDKLSSTRQSLKRLISFGRYWKGRMRTIVPKSFKQSQSTLERWWHQLHYTTVIMITSLTESTHNLQSDNKKDHHQGIFVFLDQAITKEIN